MHIDLAGEPGDPRIPNEDYASVALPASGAGGALVVLDGVTPPPDGGGCVHGVPWFTARLGGALLELSVSRRDMTLREALTSAIERTAEAHCGTCDLSHPRTPQATVVAARWDETAVEHLVLSDSVLVVEERDGRVTAVADDRLTRLPPPVPALRAAVATLPEGSAERAARVAEYAGAVEALRNTEGGFFTAAAGPQVAERALTGGFTRAQVRSLTALTDGATRWVEVFREGGWDGLPALLRTEGAAGLLSRVRAAEAADPDGRAFPRGKRHDDATVVHADFGAAAGAPAAAPGGGTERPPG
ncbi:protein phosphatase 2C domain-containing protein [Streptomyces zingiberis]|uniref:Integrase n=1 Tax=Streptomyces zingiberis TaxID=2053010 RepID=A0ABX1BUZ1_9ACTN|nr:protein phosphatase 2C domain-containing protein [Streptomyces zingiberis]NJQ00878.1 hypothetical protein [Streptomyces zingiberis]